VRWLRPLVRRWLLALEDDLSLDEMAQSVGLSLRLSTAHFARMFRKSTGETPHQFVLRQRLERATAMLRAPDAPVLDVAVACGFKTQQHFAQVFRDVWGVSPTEYRQDLVGSEASCASESYGLPFTSLLTSSPVGNL